jgi:hypothetical protein
MINERLVTDALVVRFEGSVVVRERDCGCRKGPKPLSEPKDHCMGRACVPDKAGNSCQVDAQPRSIERHPGPIFESLREMAPAVMHAGPSSDAETPPVVEVSGRGVNTGRFQEF